MALRSTPSSSVKLVSCSFAGLAIVLDVGDGKVGGVHVRRPRTSRTARWISFCNWRMLPGQSKAVSRSIGVGLEAAQRAVGLRGEAFQKGVGQRQDVVAAFAQRRQMNGNGADAVEQIFAQLAVLDGVLGLAVGGGDDAAVGLVDRSCRRRAGLSGPATRGAACSACQWASRKFRRGTACRPRPGGTARRGRCARR